MLQVTLLGEQIITDDVAGTVRTRSSRSIALIAYLSAHRGSPQPRQLIAGLFWPDSSDAQALTNLRRELHLLRHVLHDDSSLTAGGTSLCWQDTGSCRVDARVFSDESNAALRADSVGDDSSVLKHGRAALLAYTGDLLPGVIDEWVLDLRTHLARRCVEVCDLVATVATRAGELPLAVEAARRRIRLEPVEEVGYRTLMRLQADLGDRAGAISTYHHCASVLERELGLDPDPQTRELFEHLLGSAGAATPLSTPHGARTNRAGVASAPLVGRDVEFEQLLAAWHRVTDGHPQFVLVSGEAGVGKTRLVTEVAAAARAQGAVVASTQCFGTPGHLPLAPVADWLRDPAVSAADASLESIWRAEVERLVPSSTRRRAPSGGSRAKVDAWQRTRFFEGLARALTNGERPILLVLDNLQWCDEETLSFLAFCLGLDKYAPLLVAATARNDAIGRDPLAAWTTQLRTAGLLTETALGPLGVEETADLTGRLLGRPLLHADAQTLQDTTGGFPLYVVEASRAAQNVADSPFPIGGLSTVLCRRLEQATPMAREVAGLAAAVGRDFSLDLIAEASDRTAGDVVRAVDELWRLRIVRELPRGYDFSHDLLRDAAYSQVSPPGRWLLHRRLAQGLELLYADARDDISAQLADQYARGGLPERAMSYYQRAAEIAAGTFANAEAITLYRQALAILQSLPRGRSRDAAELEIVEHLAPPLNAEYGYSSPQLQHATERCLALAEHLGRRDSILTSLIGLWTSRYVQGQIIDGHQLATRALSMVDPGSELEGQAHMAFAGSSLTLGKPAQALRHFDIACERSEGAPSLIVGSKPDVQALAWSAHAHWLVGDDAHALSAARHAVGVARAADHPYSLAVALAYAAVTAQLCDLRSELDADVRELGALCDRFSFAYYREWGLVLGGWLRAGPTGIRKVRRGIGALKAEGSLVRMPYWLCLLADLLARDGQPDAARATLDAAVVGARIHEDVWWLPEVMRMRAVYDRPDDAVVRLHEGLALATRQGSSAHIRRIQQDVASYRARAGAGAAGVRPTA